MPSARNYIGIAVCLAAFSACAPSPLASAAPSSPGEQVQVARVTDGDTFVTASGVKVRVLGIDSCEMKTRGGKAARAEAVALLAGQSVTLRAEPGHDVDRYQRALRYVQLEDGRDYGTVMVAADHTAVYGKKNDANASTWRSSAPQTATGAPVDPARDLVVPRVCR